MGCAGCGSGSIIPGVLAARKNRLNTPVKRVKGYKSGGVIKSQKRLLKEAGHHEVVKAMEEAELSSKE